MLLLVAATERELFHFQGLVCGIGPVEAAINTTRALTERKPAGVLHVGIAGATDIEPPAIVIGSEAVYCDVVDAGNTMPRVERVQPNSDLLARARVAVPEAHVVPIATCARVGGGGGFPVEAMEGFAVLRACELAGVPALEVRAISNAPGEPDRSKWHVDDALAALADAVARLTVALA